MKFRRTIRLIHRDIGYLTAALIIIYSVSGVAVNHVDEWNPNYIITKDTLQLPVYSDTLEAEIMSDFVASSLKIKDKPNEFFRSGEYTLDIFYENKTVSANLETRTAILENVESRSVLRESNFLHLNNGKRWWTYIADAFAICLILLAVTGMFMIKGKKGIKGRGKWLIAIGIVIPLLFLILYF